MEDLLVSETSSELVVIANKIKKGLIAFEKKKAELIELRDEVDGLDITSVEDKAGIRQVTEGRKKLKVARVEIEKEGKSMRDPLTALSKGISSKENELVALIEPTEKKLQAKEKWVKDENDRIEREAEEAKAKRIQDRIDGLAKYGYSIDITLLTGITDEQFQSVVEDAKGLWEKEQAAEVERKRQEQEERERIVKEREELERLREKQAEADRILREKQEDMDRREREMKEKEEAERAREAQRETDEQEAALKQERTKLAERTRVRIKQLGDMGFARAGAESWSAADKFGVFIQDVQILSEEKWDEWVAKWTPEIAEFNEMKAKEAEERKQWELKEAAEKALTEEKARQEEANRQEAERIAAASDKDKFAVILSHLEALPAPVMKSAKAKKLLSEVQTLRDKIIEHIKVKA